ncbi:MAG: type II secretion system protein [Dictyoglomus sp.]
MYNRGFTLIELLLTFVILGIIATITLNFSLAIIDERKMLQKSYEIMQCLVEVRDGAFIKEEDYTDLVCFYPFSDLILVKTFDRVKNMYKVIKKIDLSQENIDLTSAVFGTNNYVYFNKLGIPSSGGTIAISYKSVRKYIIVTPATGRIYVSNEMPKSWD